MTDADAVAVAEAMPVVGTKMAVAVLKGIPPEVERLIQVKPLALTFALCVVFKASAGSKFLVLSTLAVAMGSGTTADTEEMTVAATASEMKSKERAMI